MLRASHIQDCVINRNEEICRSPPELSGQWRLAQVFDQVLAHQLPKLPWGNPHTAAATHDFG